MRLISLVLCALLLCGPAKAQDNRQAEFDYYVLALSWTPDWCALHGDSEGAAECAKHGLTFTLHGLWPQYDAGGFPIDCRSAARDPSRQDTAAMQDIMGSDGLAWHEWKTHGRCSGLSAGDYLALMRKAYAAITVPPLFAAVRTPLHIAPEVIGQAFLEANPSLSAQGIAVTCEQSMITELRICLTKDLAPRACGPAFRRCHAAVADMAPIR